MTEDPICPPLVSVIVANFNGSSYLRLCLRSILEQSISNIEVIVVDDFSTDDSVSVIREISAGDNRVKLIALEGNHGPAAARNKGLEAAAGVWIAVVDSDDFIHPERLEKLVEFAERDGADIVADDLLVFDNDDDFAPAGLLSGTWGQRPFWVEAEAYILAGRLYGNSPSLGFCKPMLRATALAELRYDESLRIGEDYDLILRLLLRGHKYRVYPEYLYFYRKHSASISHRLSEGHCRAMLEADSKIRHNASLSDELLKAFSKRTESIERAIAFDRLVKSIKQRSVIRFLTVALSSPSAVSLLRLPLVAYAARMLKRKQKPRPSPGVCLISRQRIVGATNGSSAYLLSMADYLKQNGQSVHYLSPSPATFGRWPVIALKPETAVFASYRIRGSWKVGRFLLARDPAIYLKAVAVVAERILFRLHLVSKLHSKPAPYAVAVSLTKDDQLYLARHVRRLARSIMFDYAFLTQTRPYTLCPDRPSAVVMHDMFSNRPQQFARIGQADSVTALDSASEIKLLAAADTIIAIQHKERDQLLQMGVSNPVIVAPMAADVQQHIAEGDPASILFVGSNTAPNTDGLAWFNREIFPRVQERFPSARLTVVGSVKDAMPPPPNGVSYLGIVDDLGSVYREAGIVISPLRAGTGLKIKLIEALAYGKPIVATAVTIEGLEQLIQNAVVVEDDAERFAGAIIALMDSGALRKELSSSAVELVAARFSKDACYASVLRALQTKR